MSAVSEYVADANVLDAHYAPLMARAVRSTKRMARMLDDLPDVTPSRIQNTESCAPLPTCGTPCPPC